MNGYSPGVPLRAALRLACLALTFVLPPAAAAALTAQDADRVVTVMERLQPEFGSLAYDEEVADDWFARDAEAGGVIAKAGFTRESWRDALDATMRGYLANIPQGTVDTLFRELAERLSKAPKLTSEQKAEIAAFVQEERARMDRLRAEGGADAAAVRPYVERLRRLVPDRLEQD